MKVGNLEDSELLSEVRVEEALLVTSTDELLIVTLEDTPDEVDISLEIADEEELDVRLVTGALELDEVEISLELETVLVTERLDDVLGIVELSLELVETELEAVLVTEALDEVEISLEL